MTFSDWVLGARPRTLWTSITPVLVGTSAAAVLDSSKIGYALLALIVALALQVGVNYANDYSDGVKGVDLNRIGPTRLVASGMASPSAVKRAAFLSFGVAAIAGAALSVFSGNWWFIAVGAVALFAAWGYTGTSRPYGYAGWGEVVVFVFFGPVATLGTMWTQAGRVTWWAILASISLGLYAVAMLLVNNIRDAQTDAETGKYTLAVRLGTIRTRFLYAATIITPLLLTIVIAFSMPWTLLTLLLVLPTVLLSVTALTAPTPLLAPLFLGTTAVGFSYGVLLAIGLGF